MFKNFCDTFSLKNLVVDHTCFTKTHKPPIDVFLTNRKSSFQLTQVTKTGISDVHLIVLTFMKAQRVRFKPKKIAIRDYIHFDEKSFLEDL